MGEILYQTTRGQMWLSRVLGAGKGRAREGGGRCFIHLAASVSDYAHAVLIEDVGYRYVT